MYRCIMAAHWARVAVVLGDTAVSVVPVMMPFVTHQVIASFAQDDMADVIEKIINVYVEQRTEDERFIDTFRRIGIDPFKERVYAKHH